MEQINETIQDCKIIDYYGENVNIASRMESKFSKPGGFSLHNIDYEKIKNNFPTNIKIFINEHFQIKHLKIENFTYKKNFKRSEKSLTSLKHQIKKYKIINLKSIVNFIPKD